MNAALKLGAFTVAAITIAPAAQAIVNWSNPAGATPLFTYHTGYTNSGYFGDPTLVGNTFIFTPPSFTAMAGQNSRTDTLQVDILAQPGQVITGIIIREFGTRTSSGFTTQVTATMFIKDLNDVLFPQYQDPMGFVNVANGAAFDWSGVASRGGLNLTNLQLSLTNSLTAVGSHSIQKTRVEIEIVPTPGTAVALAGAGLVLGSRRRRR
jgi:hypothetical protein